MCIFAVRMDRAVKWADVEKCSAPFLDQSVEFKAITLKCGVFFATLLVMETKVHNDFSAQPFLRWAGSKRKLIPALLSHVPHFDGRYIEPFMGSACLYFALSPKQSILGDINDDLVNAYNVVRSSPRKLYALLQRQRTGKEAYYKVRARDVEKMTPLVRASRFIYLNRFCFNGLYRTNLKGEFNVPYGGEKSGSLPSLDSLVRISQVLSGADVRNEDFRDVLSHARKGDFVYLDPPYAVENKRIFTQYGPDVFGSSDLEDLRTILEQLDADGIPFMLSYAYLKFTKEYFSKWRTNRLITTRNIAGFSSCRKTSAELLVRNY